MFTSTSTVSFTRAIDERWPVVESSTGRVHEERGYRYKLRGSRGQTRWADLTQKMGTWARKILKQMPCTWVLVSGVKRWNSGVTAKLANSTDDDSSIGERDSNFSLCTCHQAIIWQVGHFEFLLIWLKTNKKKQQQHKKTNPDPKRATWRPKWVQTAGYRHQANETTWVGETTSQLAQQQLNAGGCR